MSTKLLGPGSRSSSAAAAAAAAIPPVALGIKDSSRRKHRCWRFHVSKLAGGCGGGRRDVDVLPPFRKKYTSVKRLVLNNSQTESEKNNNHDNGGGSHSTCKGGAPPTTSICIEVEFAGPQPSQGPGALLCELLSGTSVEAKPVHLERGRKKKAKMFADAGSKSPEPKQANAPSGCGDPPSDSEKRSIDAVSTTTKIEKKRAGRGGVARGEGRNGDGDRDRDGDRDALSPTRKTGGSDRRKSRSVSSKADQGRAATKDSNNNDNNAVTPPVYLVGNSEDDASAPEAIEPIVVDEQQDDADADPSAEPSSPVRKRLRTFNVERLRCTIDRMSIVDSDSEDDGEEDEERSQPESELSVFMNTGGNWAGEALDATLSPLEEAPLLRGWSVDSSSLTEEEDSSAADGRDSFGYLMDAHQDLMLFIDGESPVAGTPESAVATRVHPSSGTDATPVPALAQVQFEETEAADFSGLPKKDVEVSVSLTRKECDFMGRAESASSSKGGSRKPKGTMSSSSFADVDSDDDDDGGLHTIIFSGLELDKSVPGIETLNAKAHFWIHSMHSVAKEAGTFQVGSDGSMRATLRYPSMRELSPVLDEAMNIRVVEVDMMVMVRSQEGDVKYASNNMKVTYRRRAWLADAPGRYPRAICRRISSPSSPENERPGATETTI